MPRSVTTLTNNNFTKGLITEASELNFPPGACEETIDCVHNVSGSVQRRKGFDFEINYSQKTIDRTNGVVSSYFWRDVAGNGNTSLVVLQIKDHLYFYNGSTTDPLSAHPIAATIDLNSFSPAGAPAPVSSECQFAAGNGRLFVAHPYLDPFAIAYDTNTQTFTTTKVTIQIRDFEGLPESRAVDQRPVLGISSLDTAHHYNLLNQGWTSDNLIVWDTARTDLPSNVDVMWLFKNATDDFDTTKIDKVIKGNSPASKGHFILDAFNQDRGAATGMGIPVQSAGYQRPATIAFFSGRIFYAGINYTGLNAQIYFTQIIERDEQFGACYQLNDPTSETSFDELASDGGVIKIQEAGTIHKLVPVPGGLAVFASNGIWMITGSSGLGFTATDYTEAKVSSINTLTHTSFVDVAGVPMWWNLEGIYRLEGTQSGMQVVPLTATTIKSYYDTIPPSEKRNARGYFNPLAYTIQWLFRSTEAGDLTSYYEYDRVLNFDIRTGAFFVWTIPVNTVKVHGMVVLENRGGDPSTSSVKLLNGNGVTLLNGSSVDVWTIGDSIVVPSFKYVVSTNNRFTFGETRDDKNFVDWKSQDNIGTNFISFFISGITLPNPMTDFENNWINLYLDNTSKFYVQGIWDFTISGDSGRWTNPQLIDGTTATNYGSVVARRKIRGHGKALQIKITSSTGHDFFTAGWGAYISSNQIP